MENALSALTPFTYDSRNIRVIERDGEAWFVAADVCAVLELSGDASQHTRRLDADEVSTLTNDQGRAGHGAQAFNIISEPGLYALIMRSRKPEAKRFSRWVRHEVLPAIRRTGRYGGAEISVAEKLKLLSAAERLGGKPAARELWTRLDLPPMTTVGITDCRAPLSIDDLAETVLRRIPAAGVVSRRTLFRSIPRGVSAAAFDAAVGTLVSEGRIVATPTTVGRVGRPSLVFSCREH